MEQTSQIAEVIGMDAHSRKISLCLMRKVNGKIVKVRTIATTIDALETTYARQMPPGVLTVLEASTNSVSIVRRLGAAGWPAQQLCADVLSGLSRQDRINDRIDAENLARVYLNYGIELRTVFTPTPSGTDMRETFFAYRDAKKDSTRAACRIWSFCSRHGLDVDRKIGKKRCRDLLAEGKKRGWSEPVLRRAAGLVGDWERAAAICDERERAIDGEVFRSDVMTRLQQIPGVRSIAAFALFAFVEDIRRFENPKKLVAYIGLNPSVCGSGEKEAKRKVSKFGRGDLKAILVEAAQSAMRTDTPLAKWAKHLLAKGKEWNVAIAALARKIAALCWHVMMGHPAQSRERQRATAVKLTRLAHRVGKDAVRAAGFASVKEFVAATCSTLYSHLPEKVDTENSLGQTA